MVYIPGCRPPWVCTNSSIYPGVGLPGWSITVVYTRVWASLCGFNPGLYPGVGLPVCAEQWFIPGCGPPCVRNSGLYPGMGLSPCVQNSGLYPGVGLSTYPFHCWLRFNLPKVGGWEGGWGGRGWDGGREGGVGEGGGYPALSLGYPWWSYYPGIYSPVYAPWVHLASSRFLVSSRQSMQRVGGTAKRHRALTRRFPWMGASLLPLGVRSVSSAMSSRLGTSALSDEEYTTIG